MKLRTFQKTTAIPTARSARSTRTKLGCESLEHRQLLSTVPGGLASPQSTSPAELGSYAGGGSNAMFGAGGLGGGYSNPVFLLTASLLNPGTDSTATPSKTNLASSDAQATFQTLQTDLSNNHAPRARPSTRSLIQLRTNLLATHLGTLSGTNAASTLQSDQSSILTSLGLNASQMSQIQSDLQAFQTSLQPASPTPMSTTGLYSSTPSTNAPTTPFASTLSPSLSTTPPVTSTPSAGAPALPPLRRSPRLPPFFPIASRRPQSRNLYVRLDDYHRSHIGLQRSHRLLVRHLNHH